MKHNKAVNATSGDTYNFSKTFNSVNFVNISTERSSGLAQSWSDLTTNSIVLNTNGSGAVNFHVEIIGTWA